MDDTKGKFPFKGSLGCEICAQSGEADHIKEEGFQGFRGILAIQTIIFIFFEIYFPAAVAHSPNTSGPSWQLVLRKTVSLFLWNPSLIRAAFIILSARTICLPFLCTPTSATLASAIFRRSIRFLIPLSVALAIATLLTNLTKSTLIVPFKQFTANVSLPTPYPLPSALTYFNALYMFFWTVRDYTSQAASRAFYNDSLWSISVIYTQSYTVYLAAVIIPFTRPKWRVGAWTFFIMTAWWIQSWAWYSISGLFLADAVFHMRLRERMATGILLRLGRCLTLCIPGWVFGVFCVLAGGTLQYFWRQWRPWFSDDPSTVAQPPAREDDYLVVMGVLLLLESLPWLRKVVGCRWLVVVGKRSLSLYLVGSIVFNTVGIALFLRLVKDLGMSVASGTAVSAVVCVVAILLLTELFYRVIEGPTEWAGVRLFRWVRS